MSISPRLLVLLLGLLLLSQAQAGTLVQMNSSVGPMVFELYDTEKPATVGLFLNWLDQGNYDGTYVHRATNNYIGQAGVYGVIDYPGFGRLNVALPESPDGSVPNEFTVGDFLPNTYGTLSMVPWTPRGPNTYVTSGFVLNFNDNPQLDQVNYGGGFPVFGRLIFGFDAFALLNPTNGNPAVRVTNYSELLSELPVLTSAGSQLNFDDLVYLNMTRAITVPEPHAWALLGAGAILLWRWRQRR